MVSFKTSFPQSTIPKKKVLTAFQAMTNSIRKLRIRCLNEYYHVQPLVSRNTIKLVTTLYFVLKVAPIFKLILVSDIGSWGHSNPALSSCWGVTVMAFLESNLATFNSLITFILFDSECSLKILRRMEKNKSVYHIKKNIKTQETLPPLQRSGLVNYNAHKNGMLYSDLKGL